MSNARTIPRNGSQEVITFTVKIEGEELARSFQVQTISVSKEINRIPMAKLVLVDGDPSKESFDASNEDLFLPGKKIEIDAGFSSEEEKIFEGIIVKHSLRARQDGSALLMVECRDETIKMTIGKNSAYFTEVLDSDVFEELIGAYELSAEVEATSVSHPELVQFNCTDWDFMLSRSEVNGQLVMVDDGTVKIAPPDFGSEPVLSLQYGATLLEFDVEMDARFQLKVVKGQNWNIADQAIQEVEGEDPETTDTGNVAIDDLSGVSSPEEYILRHSGNMAEDELQAWVDAQLLRNRMAKVCGRVKSEGFASIKPGTLVTLGGLSDRFNGDVFVSAVRHSLSEGSWHTDTQFGLSPDWFLEKFPVNQLPASGILPGIKGLQVGVVTQLGEDPDGEHRILVRLPIISAEDDGIWARVATLDAGAERGTFFLPEIEDEVIVGFINDDPRDAVVLGMLHSSAKAAPFEASDDNHEKGYVSREGMRFEFNDETKTITLETPGGNIFKLDEDEGAISMEDQNGNKVLLNSDGITLESAADIILTASGDVKAEGVNIEHTAQANFKAEGSAGIEVSSSATATIKGATVMIN